MSLFNESISLIESVIKLGGFSGYDDEPVWELISSIESYGHKSDFFDGFLIDGVKLELEASKGKLYVKYIQTPESDRGQGKATKVMKLIIDKANEDYIDVLLYPNSTGDIDESKLRSWYGKLGFVDTGDHSGNMIHEAPID